VGIRSIGVCGSFLYTRQNTNELRELHLRIAQRASEILIPTVLGTLISFHKCKLLDLCV
jgi:hypothetical protein